MFNRNTYSIKNISENPKHINTKQSKQKIIVDKQHFVLIYKQIILH